jgi:hypothetical protein
LACKSGGAVIPIHTAAKRFPFQVDIMCSCKILVGSRPWFGRLTTVLEQRHASFQYAYPDVVLTILERVNSVVYCGCYSTFLICIRNLKPTVHAPRLDSTKLTAQILFKLTLLLLALFVVILLLGLHCM